MIELYRQGRDFQSDPVSFGEEMGYEVIAPVFVIPAILLGLVSVSMMALWWWSGWGIFIFCAFVVWFVLLGIHTVYVGVTRMFGGATQRIRTIVSDIHQPHSNTEYEKIVIDVESRG